jgi:hypothetical protein
LAGCFDVGWQPGYQDGPSKRQVVLWFESQHHNTKGTAFTLPVVLTNSSNEKSNMVKWVTALTGKAPTEAERKAGFDMDALIGKSCQILVVADEEGAWPYINTMLPLNPGQGGIRAAGDYTVEPKFVQKLKGKQLSSEAAKAHNAEIASAAKKDTAEFDKNLPF